MKKFIIIMLTGILVLTANTAAAEVTSVQIEAVNAVAIQMSLEQAYEEALESNWQIKQIERQIKEIDDSIKNQKKLQDNIVINENTTDYVASILVKEGYGVESGRYNELVLRNMREKIINTVKLGVMTKYFDLKLAEKGIELHEKAYESAKKNYDDALLKYESGLITKIILTQAELAVSKAKTDLENAQDEKNIKNLELCNILDRDFDSEFELTSSMEYKSSENINLHGSIMLAHENSPDIMEKKEEIKLKEIVYEATDAYYTGGNWQLRHAAEEVEEAKDLYQRSFREVELDIRKKYLEMIKAERNYKNISETVLISQEALRIAKLFYRYDMATISDVNDAEIALKEVEIAKNSMLFAYNLSREIFTYSLEKGILNSLQ